MEKIKGVEEENIFCCLRGGLELLKLLELLPNCSCCRFCYLDELKLVELMERKILDGGPLYTC